MKKRWLLNLALLAFLVLLAVLVKYQPGAPDEEPRAGPPLTNLKADQVQRIRIARPQQDEITLERDGEEWLLRTPRRARADQFRVEGVLALAAAQTEKRFPAQELAPYGLDKPLATVWLNDVEIRLGALHPLNDLQYAWLNGEIALIPSASFRAAASQASDFFSTNLLEKDRRPVSIKLPKLSLVLREGSWQVQPEIKNLSGDRINTFVEEWRFARALNVTPHEPKSSVGKVVIAYVREDKGGDPAPAQLEIDVLSYQPELVLYRKDEGLDYHFPKGTGERLFELAAP